MGKTNEKQQNFTDKKITVKVNKGSCIGCGSCIGIAPEVFEFDEDGKSSVKRGVNPIENQHIANAAKKAKEMCPANAIDIIES